jgi:uncharacterized membrane protein
LAAKVPTGVFRVTRHPMMWGIALWGLSHMLVAPRMDSFLFNGSSGIPRPRRFLRAGS